MCKVGHWEASHVCPQTWPSFSALIQLLKWKLYLCQCVEQHALVLVCVVSFYGKPIAMCGGVWWYGFLPDPVSEILLAGIAPKCMLQIAQWWCESSSHDWETWCTGAQYLLREIWNWKAWSARARACVCVCMTVHASLCVGNVHTVHTYVFWWWMWYVCMISFRTGTGTGNGRVSLWLRIFSPISIRTSSS